MTNPPVKALLVDIDGTLVLSNVAHANAWATALQSHGFDVAPEVVRPRIGMAADKLLRGLHPDLDETSELARQIEHDRETIFLNNYLSGILPTPGAKALLEALHDLRVKIVEVSSANETERDALLAAAHVADLVECLPTKPKSGKPDPDIVYAALDHVGMPTTDVCMIGDTPYDIDAARRADVRIIAVRCGGWDERSLSRAWAVYADPAATLERLDDWAGLNVFESLGQQIEGISKQ